MHMSDGFLISINIESINATFIQCKACAPSLYYPFACSRHRFEPGIKRQQNFNVELPVTIPYSQMSRPHPIVHAHRPVRVAK